MSRATPLPPDDDLNALELALRDLTPAPTPLDRDALMFAAGQAHAARRARPALAWPLATAALALLAAGQAALLATRPTATVDRPLIVQQSPPPPAPTPPPAPRPVYRLPIPRTDQQRLALQLARYGLDALPPSPAAIAAISASPPDTPSAADLLRAEVDRILNPGESS
jgi:hypothetical protein